jgi:hypothetical protein
MRWDLCRGVLVGSAVFWGALACAPAVEAKNVTEERSVNGDFCGGFAGIPCPKGFTCVDNPRDDCDPEQGGADCGGICRKENPGQNRCTGEERGLHYVSRDPEACKALLFTCPGRREPFFNACGCGCQAQGGRCDYDDPTRTYISRDPEVCMRIRFFCETGTHFSDECGCGCQLTP